VIDLAQLDVASIPRDELPAVLGRLVEAVARVRLRLVDVEARPAIAPPEARVIDLAEAVGIANTSPRWLLAHTRGLAFRKDLSRKKPRFDERGLRAWLAGRRRG